MGEADQPAYEFGPYRIDPLRRVLLRDGEAVFITPRIFDTLLLLVEAQGRLLTKDELMTRLWPDRVVEESSLTQNIAVLRKTLREAPEGGPYIATTPGRGYQFIAPVRTVSDGSDDETEPPDRSRRRGLELSLATAAGLLAGAILALTATSSEVVERPLVKFGFVPGGSVFDAMISPNGKYIAYVAGDSDATLWIRPLGSEQAQEVEGSEGAQRPFWSPDSRIVAFSVGDEIRKVSVTGGPPVLLSRRPSGAFVGGSWSPDGASIVFSVALRRLYRVAASGGRAEALEDAQGNEQPRRYWAPRFLTSEGKEYLLYTVRVGNESRLTLRNMGTDEETVIGKGEMAAYSPTGHVLFQPNLTDLGIWAAPLSPGSGLTSEPFLVARKGRSPSVSDDGTLAYIEGESPGGWQLVLRDREGRKLSTVGAAQQLISLPALSYDDRRVAAVGLQNGNQDIWIYDLDGAAQSRLTFDPEPDGRPIWSPDGDRVAFTSARHGEWDVFTKRADGGGGATPLVAGSALGQITDWSRDGRWLLFRRDEPASGTDIWYREQGNETEGERPVLNSKHSERAAKISPNGRFVAYASDESGRYEVYVEKFPEGGSKIQASEAGGAQPRWSRDGSELFYAEAGVLFSRSVSIGDALSLEPPRRLFESPGLRAAPSHSPNYDVSADGSQFIMPEPLTSDAPNEIRVTMNWIAEFEE